MERKLRAHLKQEKKGALLLTWSEEKKEDLAEKKNMESPLGPRGDFSLSATIRENEIVSFLLELDLFFTVALNYSLLAEM